MIRLVTSKYMGKGGRGRYVINSCNDSLYRMANLPFGSFVGGVGPIITLYLLNSKNLVERILPVSCARMISKSFSLIFSRKSTFWENSFSWVFILPIFKEGREGCGGGDGGGGGMGGVGIICGVWGGGLIRDDGGGGCERGDCFDNEEGGGGGGESKVEVCGGGEGGGGKETRGATHKKYFNL